MWVGFGDGVEPSLSGSAYELCFAGVDLLRGVPAEPAVAVLAGVALQELGSPLAGVVDGVEPFRVRQVVLERFEQRLGERVVIADLRP